MTGVTERDNKREYGVAERNLIGEMGFDSLTGVLNWHAAKVRIESLVEGGGALVVCDIDHFKRINDRFGHLAGDECLQQTAKTLGALIRGRDVLGRCGGDEFVIFMPECQEEQVARQAAQRLADRFADGHGQDVVDIPLSITTGCAVCREGDTCETVFKRAMEELLGKKADMGGTEDADRTGIDNYRKDAGRIREDLMEQISTPGAYCRDYETFRSIYRFLERGIIRNGQKACVILLSVVDEEGKTLLPYEKDTLMERLGEAIRATLRLGDVYTRYTSSQYLVLVIDTSEHLADMIADRVKEKFLAGEEENRLLVHCCYELQPARYR